MLYKQTVLLTGITFLGLAGYVMRLEQLYFMTAMLVFLALGSYWLSRWAVRGLEVRRGPVRKVYEGERCDLTMIVTSRSRLPKVFLSVRDTLPEWLETLGGAEVMIATLAPGRSVELTVRLRALKRGAFQLGPIAVAATDPLGAFRTERRLEAPQELIVYPKPVRVSLGAFAGTLSFGGAETEQLSAAGAGLEFYGIRDYRPGDALRRIHWASTARRGHLHVLEFEETLGADVVIALDLRRGAHAGSGRDSSLETAVTAAASLAAHAVGNAAGVTVIGQDRRRSYRASARRPEELPGVLEALARMEADGDAGLGQVMAGANELVAGTTAVVLTAAPDAQLAAAIEAWARRQAQVVAILFDAASYGEEDGGEVYAMQRRLEAAGARVAIIRRGDGLEGALGQAMTDAA